MKNLLVAALAVIIMVSSANAGIVSADADGFSQGTDISTAFDGITLSSVGNYSGLDGFVYASGSILASTPTNVFANNLSFEQHWLIDSILGFALRADFDQLADSAAIDIIGNDEAGDIGALYAYNSADVLLDMVESDVLGYGQVFSATISRPSFDIAYIIAGGTAGTTVNLDHLTANVIPEPAAILLLGFGSLLLRKRS